MSYQTFKLTARATGLAVLLTIAACGGGGGGGGGGVTEAPPPPGDTVKGLAAVGAPLTGAQVVLRCANGVGGQTTTDNEGRWSIELRQPQFPCLATLSNSTSHSGVTLRSMALGTGHLNITPLTDLVLARAFKDNPAALEGADGQALIDVAALLPEAQDEVIQILVAQGFAATDLAVFTGEFQASKGDPYDDLLEHIAVSLADDGKTHEDLLEVIADTDPDVIPPLPNTQILDVAALAAMPQINQASLAIENQQLKMTLGSGANPVGAFVGSGKGNKAILQLAGLHGVKLRDLHSVAIELQGDEAGVTTPPISPYVSLNLTIDLQCSSDPVSSDATLNQLRERRRILSFDPYYHVIRATQSLSSEEFRVMEITPATPGWRVSGGSPIGTVAVTPNYNGSETLEGFDYVSYPDACIVDGATGDAGMYRNLGDSNCVTDAALDGTSPAACGLPYSGALIFLGSSSATQESNWLVKELKFFRQENTGDSSDVKAFRTYRFQ